MEEGGGNQFAPGQVISFCVGLLSDLFDFYFFCVGSNERGIEKEGRAHDRPCTKSQSPNRPNPGRQNLREPGVSSASGEQQPDCLIVYVCVCVPHRSFSFSFCRRVFCFFFVSSFAAGGIE